MGLRRAQSAVQDQLAPTQRAEVEICHMAGRVYVGETCVAAWRSLAQQMEWSQAGVQAYTNLTWRRSATVSVGNTHRSLTTATWNACGLASDYDYASCLLAMPHVAFIQEGKATEPSSRGVCSLSSGGSWIFTGGSALHRELAVVTSNLGGLRILHAEQYERSIVVRLRWQCWTMTCINSHLPYATQGLAALQGALGEITPSLDAAAASGDIILWGMDSNTVLGLAGGDCLRAPGLRIPEAASRLHAKRAQELAGSIFAYPLQVSSVQGSEPSPTWYPWGKEESQPGRQIDYLVSSLPICHTWLWDLVGTNPSDHAPVYCELLLPSSRAEKQQQRQQQHRYASCRVPLDWRAEDLVGFKRDVATVAHMDGLALHSAAETLNSIAVKYGPSRQPQLSSVKAIEKDNMRRFLAAPDAVSRRRALRILQCHRKKCQKDRQTTILHRLLRSAGGGFGKNQRATTQLAFAIPVTSAL